MKERFSKEALAKWADRRMKHLEKEHGFHRGDGWGKYEKRSVDVNRAFGEYTVFRDMCWLFKLPEVKL